METPEIFQEKNKTDLPKVLQLWIEEIKEDPEEILLDNRSGYLSLSFSQFRITLKVDLEKIYIRNVTSLAKGWAFTAFFYKLVTISKEQDVKYIYVEKVDAKSARYWVREHEFLPVEGVPGLYVMDIEKLGHFYRKVLKRAEPWFIRVVEDEPEN